MGLADAIYQYLRSGKRPGEKADGSFDLALAMRDLAYPRNGELDANGREEREAAISYLKDYFSWAKHPITTLEHKLKPFLSMAWEAIENEDFYGNALRDENDPFLTQTWDTLRASLERLLPISSANALHRAGEGATPKQWLEEWVKIQAIPFTPASVEVERSDLENYLHGLQPPTHRTKEEAEKAAARRQFRVDLRAGDPDARAKARAAGVSTQSLRAQVRAEAQGPLRSAYERTTLTQAIQGYELATPEERTVLKGVLQRKVASLMKDVPAASKTTVFARAKQALTLPTAKP